MIAFNDNFLSSSSGRLRFPPGQIVITPNALAQLPHAEVFTALTRHLTGDWRDCSSEDRQANERALESGGRVFSVYHSADQQRFWIITEADHTLTTVLMPDDY
ncbi:hypothetical protein [Rubinisphaera italica]|uniref:Plasmid related protein n=1 Tax=Rubinisphaera italica TaxID=2527969 RepID=A0A5C5X9S4_9PLAN|nr:hypothetical protein [Rubinisphaera italica]TWT59710.1 hypothetical protein Pan54_04200 [Rubinisphaera italica]